MIDLWLNSGFNMTVIHISGNYKILMGRQQNKYSRRNMQAYVKVLRKL